MTDPKKNEEELEQETPASPEPHIPEVAKKVSKFGNQ
jgi:hypothetical protein